MAEPHPVPSKQTANKETMVGILSLFINSRKGGFVKKANQTLNSNALEIEKVVGSSA